MQTNDTKPAAARTPGPVAFKKVRHAPYSRGGEGHTTYSTPDGRFQISKGYGRGWRNNTYWQVTTADGSTPFRGMFGPNTMGIQNFDSMADAREAISDIYAAEAVQS